MSEDNRLWASYVAAVAGDMPAQAIADQIAERVGKGVTQPTVSRWLNGRHSGELRPGSVAAFATAFDRPVLEAFLAAFLTSGLLSVKDVENGLDSDSVAFVIGLETSNVSSPRRSSRARRR